MSNIGKKIKKLDDRIAALEAELHTSLQKKTSGKAIDVPKFTSEIARLKAERSQLMRL